MVICLGRSSPTASSSLPAAPRLWANGAGHTSPPIWPCSDWGLPCHRPLPAVRWALTPPFTLALACAGAVCFLWPFPSPCGAQALPGSLPDGARTFLGTPEVPRITALDPRRKDNRVRLGPTSPRGSVPGPGTAPGQEITRPYPAAVGEHSRRASTKSPWRTERARSRCSRSRSPRAWAEEVGQKPTLLASLIPRCRGESPRKFVNRLAALGEIALQPVHHGGFHGRREPEPAFRLVEWNGLLGE